VLRLCVFCGAASGRDGVYQAAAGQLGRALAERGITLVYGGASVGLMGALADAALDAGGHVIGVIPSALVARELAHQGLTELHVVEDMHQRKARMAELADGFVAMPGGAGTLEELFETWTWGQLGLHAKPCALFDMGSYYQPLRVLVDRMVGEGFLRPTDRDMLLIEQDPGRLLDRMAAYQAPAPRWAAPSAAAGVAVPAPVDALAWVLVADRRLLVVRSCGKDAFYLPGGKREPGESDAQALAREVGEELSVRLRLETLSLVGVFIEAAHGYPGGRLVRLVGYSAGYQGMLQPGAKVREARWVSHAERNRCAPAARLVVDTLHQRGAID
jgi:uncharacterized protein (TIGR00730 family)